MEEEIRAAILAELRGPAGQDLADKVVARVRLAIARDRIARQRDLEALDEEMGKWTY